MTAAGGVDVGYLFSLALVVAPILAMWFRRRDVAIGSMSAGFLAFLILAVVVYADKVNVSDRSILQLGIIGVVAGALLVTVGIVISSLWPTRSEVGATSLLSSLVVVLGTAVVSNIHTTALDCSPTWKQNPGIDHCPFGDVWLGDVTRPYVWYEGYPGLSFASVVITVSYSLVSFAVVPVALIYFLRAALLARRPWNGLHHWNSAQPLADEDLWRLRHMQEVLKLLLFSALTVCCKWAFTAVFKFLLLVDPEQRWFYVSPRRPPRSCVTSCAMPNGQSLWAFGLLTYGFITFCFEWAAPHLMRPAPGGEPPHYTEQNITLLGLHPIATRSFFKRCFWLLLLLAPVPLARILLDDASVEQALVGCMLGALLAVVFHMGYVIVLRNETVAKKLRTGLLATAVQLEKLCCCHWLPAGLRVRADGLGIPLVDLQGAAERPLLELDTAQVHWERPRGARPVDLPGFEFLGIETLEELEGFSTALSEADADIRRLRANREFVQRLHVEAGQLCQRLVEATRTGNIGTLRETLGRHHQSMAALRDDAARLGETETFNTTSGLMVEPGHQGALRTYQSWQECLEALQQELGHVRLDAAGQELERRARTVFAVMLKALVADLDLSVSAPDELRRVADVLCRWQRAVPERSRPLVEAIINKAVVGRPQEYGTFCFSDLDFCLRLVCQARQDAADVFVAKGLEVIQDAQPKDLRDRLNMLQVLISFIGYLTVEDLQLTSEKFQTTERMEVCSGVRELVQSVCQAYCGATRGSCNGQTLLELQDLDNAIRRPDLVIEAMKGRDRPLLGRFKDIFVKLAEQKFQQFKVIMVPHHVQVVALLVFKRFLELRENQFKAVIARVGTGEGKSMLIATLATYVAKEQGKKVHVVGTRAELVSRDFGEFEGLFRAFGLKPLLLTSGSQNLDKVWDFDIVYLTPKQLLMIYKREAMGTRHFHLYAQAVLLQDEIDALVVDRDPNDTLIFPNKALGAEATAIAKGLWQDRRHRGAARAQAASTADREQESHRRAVRELWRRAERFDPAMRRHWRLQGDSFVALDRNGDPDPDRRSNQLEVLNYRHHLMNCHPDPPPIEWGEPFYVMSKPHIFATYSCALGFSGTLGNQAEREFIAQSYQAAYIDVPEFLSTCRGTNFHTAEWVQRVAPTPGRLWPRLFAASPDAEPGAVREARSIWVAADEAGQINMVAQVAFRARRHVPVLVIARDAQQGRRVLDVLRQQAERHEVDAQSDVLDLTRLQLEADMRTYHSNRSDATQPAGAPRGVRASAVLATGAKQWRITITDNTGGRGTDYQMNDQEPDDVGGLLLIIMNIPLSEREWVQYKGRTARQHWRGQMCAVLCRGDYAAGVLPDGTDFQPEELEARIRAAGEVESQRLLAESRNSLLAGRRANELCEAALALGLPQGDARTRYMKLVGRHLKMSFQEMEQEARAVMGGQDPGRTRIPRQLLDHYKPDRRGTRKSAIFALDVSSSMGSYLDEDGAMVSMLMDNIHEVFQRNNVPRTISRICAHDHVKPAYQESGMTEERVLALLREHESVFSVSRDGAEWTVRMNPEGVLQTTRLGLCKEQGVSLLTQHFNEATARRGLATFGEKLELVENLDLAEMAKKLRRQQPDRSGGTRLNDALWQCATTLQADRDPELSRWLILLTDGGNNVNSPPASKTEEEVAEALRHFEGTLVIISVQGGEIQQADRDSIERWVGVVNGSGHRGLHIPVELGRDAAAAIRGAFEEVDWLIDCEGVADTE